MIVDLRCINSSFSTGSVMIRSTGGSSARHKKGEKKANGEHYKKTFSFIKPSYTLNYHKFCSSFIKVF